MKHFAILLSLTFLLAACRPPADDGSAPPGVTAEISLDGPAAVGPTTLTLNVSGTDSPVSRVTFTGDMTHAGMVPVIVQAEQAAPGVWQADDFAFHMGGDWFILAEVGLEDGTTFEITLPVSVNGG